MRARWSILLFAGISLLLAGPASPDVEIVRSTVGSGGDCVVGGEHLLHCTIGQDIAGVATGPSHICGAGFWSRFEPPYSSLGDWEVWPTDRYLFDGITPNPFRGSTTLQYCVPTACHVSVMLYDVNGREVYRIADERVDAGLHRVSFDGSGLSSGVYFCRMQADDFVACKKVVVLR
jgi:hypothetical protein